MTDCLREPVFLVGEIDEDINYSLPPVSGEEYIKRVVVEAQKCADVVVADIDQARLTEQTIYVNDKFSGCVTAPEGIGPSLFWQRCQLSDFSAIRLYVTQLKNEIQTCKRKWKPPKIDVPSIDDEKGWIKFCLGTHEEQERFTPTLNVIFCFNQSTVQQLLEYFVEYVKAGGKIEYKVGQWIYALLVVLEIPLTPDTCSCLRTLAKTCSILRADNTDKEIHEIRASNLFICLVARYFRQLDLADP